MVRTANGHGKTGLGQGPGAPGKLPGELLEAPGGVLEASGERLGGSRRGGEMADAIFVEIFPLKKKFEFFLAPLWGPKSEPKLIKIDKNLVVFFGWLFGANFGRFWKPFGVDFWMIFGSFWEHPEMSKTYKNRRVLIHF